MAELTGNVTIVTGASRDIGAEIALEVARQGGHVVIGCNDKAGRAAKVADEIDSFTYGRVHTETVAADLRTAEGAEELIERAVKLANDVEGQLTALVLSAAMGYGRSQEEAAALNLHGNLSLAKLFSATYPGEHENFDRRDILFLQSHPSHFFTHPGMQSALTKEYLPVAASKYEAEAALRKEFVDEGYKPDRRLLVLSADLVEGTFVAKALDREYRKSHMGADLLDDRNVMIAEIVGGSVPTKEFMGTLAVNLLQDNELPNGHIRFLPQPILEEGGVLRAASAADLSFGVGDNPAMYSFVS